ncbi:MAG: FtsW/RodA/SpoVE family cell cycle protein, partial [Patescibacteria group bacterium]
MTKRSLLDVDWTLVLPVFVLVLLSLTTLFSISFSLFRSQFIFLIISLFAFLFFSQVNYRIIKLYSAPIYITSLVLLALVLVLGAATRGSVRWIEIWGIKIQFSEILKPFLLVSFASFLSSRENYSFKTLLTTIIFLAPISLLI